MAFDMPQATHSELKKTIDGHNCNALSSKKVEGKIQSTIGIAINSNSNAN